MRLCSSSRMSACVIPVLERLKKGNRSARFRGKKAAAAVAANRGSSAVMAPDTVRMAARSSSVPPEPRSRRGIALAPDDAVGGGESTGMPLPQRDSRGFTIAKSGPGNVLLRIRHDNPTLGLGDAAYQRQHQAHRMNVRQYQELRRQLSSRSPPPEDGSGKGEPPRGVMSLGLPDHLRPGTLFRRIRDLDSGSVNSNSNLDSSNSGGSSDCKRSLPRRSKKPSTFERPLSFEGQPMSRSATAAAPRAPHVEQHFYSSLKKSDSFSSGRGSDSTSCSSSSEAAAAMAVATFIPPNGGRRPPPYLLPKALSPCPPTKMHPFIPNLDSALRQVRQQQRADPGAGDAAVARAERRKGRQAGGRALLLKFALQRDRERCRGVVRPCFFEAVAAGSDLPADGETRERGRGRWSGHVRNHPIQTGFPPRCRLRDGRRPGRRRADP